MKTARNTVYSLFSTIASALSSFLLVPLITSSMGVEAYGYIGVSMAFINVGMVVSLAITSMSTRYLIVFLNNRRDEVERIFNSLFAACTCIAMVLSILFFAIIVLLPFIMNITSDYVGQVRLLFLFMTASFVITIIETPFLSGQYFSNDLRRLYVFQGLSQISRVAGPWMLFQITAPQLWVPYACAFILDVCGFVAYIKYFRLLFPSININIRMAKLSYIGEIVKNGSWVSVSKAAAVLLSTVSAYLANILVGAYAAGIYSSILQLQSFFAVFTNALISSLVPNILNRYSLCESTEFALWIRKYIAYVGICVGSCAGVAIVYAVPFFDLWLDMNSSEYFWVVCLVLATCALSYPFELYNQALIAMTKVRFPAIVSMIFGIINVMASIVLCACFKWGLIGIAAASSITCIVRGWLLFPPYFSKEAGVPCRKMYFASLKGPLAFFFSIFSASILAFFFPEPSSWGVLIVDGLVSAIICFSVSAVLFFSHADKQILRNRLKAVVLKKKQY